MIAKFSTRDKNGLLSKQDLSYRKLLSSIDGHFFAFELLSIRLLTGLKQLLDIYIF